MNHSFDSFAKTARHALALVSLCLLAPGTAKALDISQTIEVERYTILDDETFQYDTGFLHLNGKFELVTSDIETYDMYGLSSDFVALFSGKPMVSEYLFDDYQSMNVIPHWVRSKEDYAIGWDVDVAVAVKGKGDPNPAITINTQPQSDVEALGDWAYFYVDAEPYGCLTYQWRFNGKDLVGQTDTDLSLTNITASQAGIYTVALSTGSKPVLSKPALLKIDNVVVIKTEPKSQTVKAGKSAVFRVAVSGSAPFGYQWYFNDQPISNATKSFYTISRVGNTNAGNYAVVVSNPVSWRDSSEAALTVTP